MVEEDKRREPVAREGAEEPDNERRAKPLLTVEQQIAHMKSKGITFELCSEEDTAEHLRTKRQSFRVYAYRRLFDGHIACKDAPRIRGRFPLDFSLLRGVAPSALLAEAEQAVDVGRGAYLLLSIVSSFPPRWRGGLALFGSHAAARVRVSAAG